MGSASADPESSAAIVSALARHANNTSRQETERSDAGANLPPTCSDTALYYRRREKQKSLAAAAGMEGLDRLGLQQMTAALAVWPAHPSFAHSASSFLHWPPACAFHGLLGDSSIRPHRDRLMLVPSAFDLHQPVDRLQKTGRQRVPFGQQARRQSHSSAPRQMCCDLAHLPKSTTPPEPAVARSGKTQL